MGKEKKSGQSRASSGSKPLVRALGEDSTKNVSKKKGNDANKIDYAHEIQELRATIPCWDNMFSSTAVSPEERAQAWVRLEILGQPLIERYAWAVPDEKALRICAAFDLSLKWAVGAAIGPICSSKEEWTSWLTTSTFTRGLRGQRGQRAGKRKEAAGAMS
jgi:hypothetical protein